MARSDPKHPTAERLRAFASGALEDVEVQRIAAHLSRCAACRVLVDSLFAANPLLTQLRSASRPDSKVQENKAQRRRAARALQRRRLRKPDAGKEKPSGRSTSDLTARDQLTPLDDEPEDEPFENEQLPRQLGEYDLLAIAGRGGMGVVYRAQHRSTRRYVALKTIRRYPLASGRNYHQFRTESELAARVRHPNVVQVFEVGVHLQQPFLAMEWVDGGTLADSLHGLPWPGRQAARLVQQLAWGIHAAHRQGVIHRDLKPANILLEVASRQHPVDSRKPENHHHFASNRKSASLLSTVYCLLATPKIADFGLARPLHASADPETTSCVAGTPHYMAPEQAAGCATSAGPAVDIYALGVVLYELLTGRVPFWGRSTEEVLDAVLSATPEPPRQLRPDISDGLEAITLRCLQKNPSRRYPTAKDLARDLSRFAD